MEEESKELHKYFNNLKRYHFSKEEIVKKNIHKKAGIYIMFEKGEKIYNMDRIVRIGIAKGKRGLYGRIKNNHYKGTHDNSTFRRLIGDALLQRGEQLKEIQQYIEIWNMNIKNEIRKQDERYNEEKEKKIEEEITKYIEKNITFTYVEIPKEKCEEYETKLISTIATQSKNRESQKWLGKFSNKKEIKDYGLWNSDKVKGKAFENMEEIKQFEKEVIEPYED